MSVHTFGVDWTSKQLWQHVYSAWNNKHEAEEAKRNKGVARDDAWPLSMKKKRKNKDYSAFGGRK